jgi:hypothetical protein
MGGDHRAVGQLHIGQKTLVAAQEPAWCEWMGDIHLSPGYLAPKNQYFCLAVRLCLLRRQAARPPKKAPARVNTQMVMVTASSLVVIMCAP